MHKGDDESPWYILGGGAIGSLWACYLTMAGLPVVLITRQHPIRELTLGQNTYTIGSKTPELVATQSKSIDKLIVCTKAPDTLAAVTAIKNVLSPNANILLLQNGMGSQQSVANALNHNIAVFAGVITHGAWKPSTTQVVHAGVGKITIGAMNPQAQQNRAEFMALLADVELNLISSDNIERDLLKKWVINCAINPLTAVYRCKNGELNTNPSYRQACSQLCDEIQQVITAMGMADKVGNIETLAREVIAQTAENISSMHQDILKGRPTEIDFINGYLVTQADILGLSVPINRSLVEHIKSI